MRVHLEHITLLRAGRAGESQTYNTDRPQMSADKLFNTL